MGCIGTPVYGFTNDLLPNICKVFDLSPFLSELDLSSPLKLDDKLIYTIKIVLKMKIVIILLVV
jgi:hypothetical protein